MKFFALIVTCLGSAQYLKPHGVWLSNLLLENERHEGMKLI